MFNRLNKILAAKFSRKDDLSRQVEIARTLDISRKEFERLFPNESIEVVSMRNKTMTVRVTSSVAANELRLHEPKFIVAVNEQLGKEAVNRIVYRF